MEVITALAIPQCISVYELDNTYLSQGVALNYMGGVITLGQLTLAVPPDIIIGSDLSVSPAERQL